MEMTAIDWANMLILLGLDGDSAFFSRSEKGTFFESIDFLLKAARKSYEDDCVSNDRTEARQMR